MHGFCDPDDIYEMEFILLSDDRCKVACVEINGARTRHSQAAPSVTSRWADVVLDDLDLRADIG